MLALQRIALENVLVYKTVRLRALQDSPTAFGSTYAREARLSDEEWRQRALRCTSDGSTGYLAFDGAVPCGLVVCFEDERNAQCADVISMWVDPGHRRGGVGTALIDAVQSWAVSRSIHQLRLMVTSVNPDAIRFYERLGFCMTGKTEPYPNDPAIFEYEMVLRLNLEVDR